MDERTVAIPAGEVVLDADLTVPAAPRCVVAFAHGSGSSRRSSRNRAVAATLVEAGVATLLLDLLTPEEAAEDERTLALRFDVDLLAERVVAAVDHLAAASPTAGLPIGVFGASTGAAAALVAAAARPDTVSAVVSRGGRPDLAGGALAAVRAPTLLVVGGDDRDVLALNEAARRRLSAPSQLEVIPGATHLFAEPGALERVAELAASWFAAHDAPPGGARQARHGGGGESGGE